MDDLYRMILVDDEDEVRGRISLKISHEAGLLWLVLQNEG